MLTLDARALDASAHSCTGIAGRGRQEPGAGGLRPCAVPPRRRSGQRRRRGHPRDGRRGRTRRRLPTRRAEALEGQEERLDARRGALVAVCRPAGRGAPPGEARRWLPALPRHDRDRQAPSTRRRDAHRVRRRLRVGAVDRRHRRRRGRGRTGAHRGRAGRRSTRDGLRLRRRRRREDAHRVVLRRRQRRRRCDPDAQERRRPDPRGPLRSWCRARDAHPSRRAGASMEGRARPSGKRRGSLRERRRARADRAHRDQRRPHGGQRATPRRRRHRRRLGQGRGLRVRRRARRRAAGRQPHGSSRSRWERPCARCHWRRCARPEPRPSHRRARR